MYLKLSRNFAKAGSGWGALAAVVVVVVVVVIVGEREVGVPAVWTMTTSVPWDTTCE
jgi:hypothetical protein